ncbi:hypothetical protein BGZ94_008495 [Podila epigama]|nr:hypothetical protein BGZ94_008495 [Podila epigama]
MEEYYGSVLVGTPGQEVKLNFDTGSSDIWFPSSTCSSAECGKHVRFDASKSSTYQNDGRSWTISYGDGSKASGYLGSDMVNVGGIAVRQTIGLATKESSHFESSEEDGLFGLGFNTIQTVRGVKTFMDNAVAAGLVDQPVVSVFLPSVRRNGGKGGEYLFGAIDASKFQGALTYVPVTRRGYWQVLVQDVAYNGQSIGQSSQAIIDTGATLVMVGDTVAKTIHDKIEGAFYDDSENGWVVPCSITSRSGDVSFKMGGASFKVPLADLAYQERSGRAGGSDHFCYSGIQGGQDGLWILGDIFIKNNYCVFSQASPPSVGIAPLAY